jgi:hypothetical protein
MRSFFVVYAVLLSCMLLPGTTLAVKKKPGRITQVGGRQVPPRERRRRGQSLLDG